jgi:hypothetical protein
MNSREIEQIEKKSLYSTRISSDLKNTVIQSILNEFEKQVKRHTSRKNCVLVILEEDSK